MLIPEQYAAALDALRSGGLMVTQIEFDGQLHRVPTQDKPNSKNGAYIAYGDAPASVWWQNLATDETGTWTAKGQGKLSPEARQALALRMEEARKARDEEQARIHAEAAAKSKAIYSAAADCTEHPYLTTKGVKAVPGLKCHKGAVVVPLRDENNGIVSLQFIDAGGNKRFLSGGRKKGCFFPIGGKDVEKPLVICEGLATGLSLHECLDSPVLVAFDAGNLLPVAEMARAIHSERGIIIAADNDVETDGNPGVTKATAAALAVDGFLAVPSYQDSTVDWNDLHQKMNAGEVHTQFMNREKPVRSEGEARGGEEGPIAPPPPVPLEAFPVPVADLLTEAAEAFTAPMQIPAACLLGMLSCLVGRTRLISLRPSWIEAGNIWIATVAPSGVGKTPCAAAFFAPIKKLEHEAFKGWREEYANYEDELELVRKERAKAKRGDTMPDRPLPPQRRQAYVDDATVEALGEVLSENPRGIMWRKDELAGLLADMDKYSSGNGGGGTRSRLLSAYDCQEWKTSRTSDPTRNLYIPHACVGIFGGIQPDMLPKVFEAGEAGADEASGFLQRFMLIRAEREKPSYWTETYLSQPSKDLLSSIAAILWGWEIEYDSEGREVDKIVPVSPQAKAAFVKWHDGISQEEFFSQNSALLSKLKGQAQRICLLLHCMDEALAGSDGMRPVSEDCMRRALLLADWVKAHQEQCWQFFKPGKSAVRINPLELAIMEVVVEHSAKIESDGWRISNEELHSLVGRKLGMPGLSPVSIGKAASRLDLPSTLIGESRQRGRTVTPERINSFKTIVSSVSSVSPCCRSKEKSQEQLSPHLSPFCLTSPPETVPRQIRDGSETDAFHLKSVAGQGSETDETDEADASGKSFNYDDPNFPDEVTI